MNSERTPSFPSRLPQVGTVRVMALEQLDERLLARDVARHYGVA